MYRWLRVTAAIDGPINEVIAKFEKEYAGKQVYCARGAAEGFMYGILGAAETVKANPKAGMHIVVIGPSWAMAYAARSYALTEMNRTTEAEADISKALALSPMDSQYKNELAYLITRRGEVSEALALYKEAEANAETTSAHPVEMKCAALRGQGYDLVELHRLDEAEAAYKKMHGPGAGRAQVQGRAWLHRRAAQEGRQQIGDRPGWPPPPLTRGRRHSSAYSTMFAVT